MSDPNSSLIQSIGSNSLDIVSDTAEVSLDAILDEGLLQDIPVFGSIVKLTKIGLTVRDHLFINKLRIFLKHINSIDSQTRQLFLDKHFKDEKSSINLGEKLINTIDKIDSNQKAHFIAKAFKLFMLEEIDSIQFYDLLYTIENFKLHYSKFFIDTCLNIEELKKDRQDIVDHFFVTGLFLENNDKRLYTYNLGEKIYSNNRITQTGMIFLEEILDYDRDGLRKSFVNKIMALTYMDFSQTKSQEIHRMNEIDFHQLINNKTLNELLTMQYSGNRLRFFENQEWVNVSRSMDGLEFIFYGNRIVT